MGTHIKIIHGMCDLFPVRNIGQQLPKEHLLDKGYYKVQHTPGLFRHKYRTVWFTMVVDDFGVKYWQRTRGAFIFHFEQIL